MSPQLSTGPPTGPMAPSLSQVAQGWRGLGLSAVSNLTHEASIFAPLASCEPTRDLRAPGMPWGLRGQWKRDGGPRLGVTGLDHAWAVPKAHLPPAPAVQSMGGGSSIWGPALGGRPWEGDKHADQWCFLSPGRAKASGYAVNLFAQQRQWGKEARGPGRPSHPRRRGTPVSINQPLMLQRPSGLKWSQALATMGPISQASMCRGSPGRNAIAPSCPARLELVSKDWKSA